MKIALPTIDDRLDNHFGHSDYFSIYEFNDKKELQFIEKLETKKGCGCKTNLAGTLAEKEVTLLIAGGIGGGAVKELQKRNIEVHGGYQGTITNVLNQWMQNPGPVPFSICTQHDDCEN